MFLSAAAAQEPSAPARSQAPQARPAADPVPQLEQALAKNPDDPKLNVALGVAYLKRGEKRARSNGCSAR